MTRAQFLRDLYRSPEPLRRTPIHYGRYLFKGNAPEPWGEYPLYNSRHLPTIPIKIDFSAHLKGD